MKCKKDKKGCSLFRRTIEEPAESSAPAGPSSTTDAPLETENVDDRARKRRKVHDSPVLPTPATRTSPRRTTIPEVVIPLRSTRPIIAAAPAPPIPPAPSAPPSRRPSSSFSFSPVVPSSSFSSGSQLGPPSTIGTSRSVPDFSAQSLRLEVSLLQSRLTATEQLLRREQERSRQELATLQEQIIAERRAYMEFIDKLKGDMPRD